MAVTGRQLLDFVNERGDEEHGVCQCGHWWEEHANGAGDACLDSATDRGERENTKHAFVYSDEATAESEYLNERAQEFGFLFEAVEDAGP